jgi:hypothetical protein
MANTSRVNGLRPVKHQNGSPYNGQVTEYFIPSGNAVATFVGDLVTADGTGDTVAAGGKGKGVQSVVQAAAGQAVLGVIVGFATDPTALNSPQYRTASTGRYVLVADQPDLIFEVQEDAVGGALAVADVGLNADFVVGAGSTTTGASGVQLDSSTKAITATLPLRIVGFVQREDNEVGSANAKVLVKINNHQFNGGTGAAGV